MTPEREALVAALQFINDEYHDARAASLEGDPLHHSARKIRDQLVEAISAAPGEPCAWRLLPDRTVSGGGLTSDPAVADGWRKMPGFVVRSLYDTPQPAAGWNEAISAAAKWHESEAAHAKVIYSEMDRYSDDHEERAGWRSYKDKEDRHLSYAAHIRTLRREAPAPAEERRFASGPEGGSEGEK